MQTLSRIVSLEEGEGRQNSACKLVNGPLISQWLECTNGGTVLCTPNAKDLEKTLWICMCIYRVLPLYCRLTFLLGKSIIGKFYV